MTPHPMQVPLADPGYIGTRAMIAFWWEDWPGSSLRPGWSGLLDTGLVIIAAILLAMLGQIVVGHLDLRGIFDPAPGPGHLSTYPATLPPAGAAFVAMLQLTLVCEGWPLRRLGRFTAGIAALVVSWVVALALYVAVVKVDAVPGSGLSAHTGPLPGAEIGAVLVVIGAWQVLLFVACRGWPFAGRPWPSTCYSQHVPTACSGPGRPLRNGSATSLSTASASPWSSTSGSVGAGRSASPTSNLTNGKEAS
jgi:hypothetical protein